MTPTAFGHYTVIRPLGSGGMADVYLAHDPTLDRQVALKAPRAEFFSADGRARFQREAKAAAALEHVAIVPIYDYNEQNGLPYMVMRYLTGGTLEERLHHRRYTPAEALPVLARVAAALDYAHGRGIIHRDVKAANILFDDKENPYIADFGIAWMATAGETNRLTVTGEVRGTFDYISPEQARGDKHIDGRSDLYALGIVLFEMLTGDVPYHAESAVSLAVQHISAPIPDIRARRPDLPPALQNVIIRALAKRPDDRYPSGAALVADLQRALAGGRIDTPRPTRTATPSASSHGQGNRTYLWLAGAAVAGVAVALFLLLRPTAGVTATNPTSPAATLEVAAKAATPSPEMGPTSTSVAVKKEPPLPDDGITVNDPGIAPELLTATPPDEIVFQSNRDGDFEIYIMEVDGSNLRQLTDNEVDDNFPRVSADGRRIAFQSMRDGNLEIYVMNRDGDQQTRLTFDADEDKFAEWSPDGTEIVFVSKRDSPADLFVMAADGSDVRRITDSPELEGRVRWSPDGQSLAYNASLEPYWQIYVPDADGASRRKITNSTYDEWSPEWSPDGEWLLFHSERDSRTNPGIYVMRPDGSDARLLYNGPYEEWGATWSADGSQIIFAINEPGDVDNLYIMDADGGRTRLLVERASYPSWAVGVAATEPANSADVDGQALAISVSATATRTRTGLTIGAGQSVVIEVTGGGWRAGAGAAWPSVGGAGDPQVVSKAVFPLPDRAIMTLIGGIGDSAPFAIGDRLVFTADAPGELWLGPNDDNPADNDGELRVRVTLNVATGDSRGQPIAIAAAPIPLTGDGLIRLTFGERAHYTAVFAPDQSRILMSVEMADGWQVFEADPNGGGLGRQLTHGSNNHYQVDVSPDGRTFLTSANLDGDGDIYLFDTATGEMLQQLTDRPGVDYQPRWLPDGEHFIFSTDDEGIGNDEIFLGTLDGQLTQLIDNGTFDGFASPSHDGQWITFYSGRDDDFEIYVMDINGGNQRRLTTSPGRDASPSFSPDGRWIVFESDRGGNYQLYAVPFEGGEATRLTDSSGNNFVPIISPDGQWLMFQSDRGGYMDIYRQPWKK